MEYLWNEYQYEVLQEACEWFNDLYKLYGWTFAVSKTQDRGDAIRIDVEPKQEWGIHSQTGVILYYGLTNEWEYEHDCHVVQIGKLDHRYKVNEDKDFKELIKRFESCCTVSFEGRNGFLPQVSVFNTMAAKAGFEFVASPCTELIPYELVACQDYTKQVVYNLYLPNGDVALDLIINGDTYEWNLDYTLGEFNKRSLTKGKESLKLLAGAAVIWKWLGFTDNYATIDGITPAVAYAPTDVATDRMAVAISRFNRFISGEGYNIRLSSTMSKDVVEKGEIVAYAYSLLIKGRSYGTVYIDKYGELDFNEISIDRKYLDKVEDVFSFAFDAVNDRYQFVRDITKEEA